MKPILLAVAPFLLLSLAVPARAATGSEACPAPLLSALGRELKVAHFAPSPNDAGTDAAGVVVANACKPLPSDPRTMLAAVAWNAGAEDAKSLVVAALDADTAAVVALYKGEIGEDAATRVDDGSLRLDTAAYDLAPGVRAFGLDVSTSDGSCGDGGSGPSRALYVRDGKALRPVLDGLATTQWRYLRGNQPRCVSDPKEAETALLETWNITIALGAAGKGGWRDLLLTATSTRSDHLPGRKPLHFRLAYDGDAYPLVLFLKAYDRWRQ